MSLEGSYGLKCTGVGSKGIGPISLILIMRVCMFPKGEGRREKGEGRREKGEGRREKGEGRTNRCNKDLKPKAHKIGNLI